MNWESLLSAYPDEKEAILRARKLREILTNHMDSREIPILDENWKNDGLKPFVEKLAPLCVDAWNEYFGSKPPFDMEEILNACAQGEAVPEIAGIDAGALDVIVNDAFSLFLHRMREKNPMLIPESWDKGFCPFCDSAPHIAFDSETGRELFCPMCGHSWRFRRFKCPVCNNTDHTTLGYFEVDGIEGTRVSICRKCNSYLKVIDLKIRTAQDYETEDTLSLELDKLAADEGFTPA
jgi:formate dehydrogenase maturation protein FdhE